MNRYLVSILWYDYQDNDTFKRVVEDKTFYRLDDALLYIKDFENPFFQVLISAI